MTRPSGSSPSVLLVALLVGVVVLSPSVALTAPAGVDGRPPPSDPGTGGEPVPPRCADPTDHLGGPAQDCPPDRYEGDEPGPDPEDRADEGDGTDLNADGDGQAGEGPDSGGEDDHGEGDEEQPDGEGDTGPDRDGEADAGPEPGDDAKEPAPEDDDEQQTVSGGDQPEPETEPEPDADSTPDVDTGADAESDPPATTPGDRSTPAPDDVAPAGPGGVVDGAAPDEQGSIGSAPTAPGPGDDGRSASPAGPDRPPSERPPGPQEQAVVGLGSADPGSWPSGPIEAGAGRATMPPPTVLSVAVAASAAAVLLVTGRLSRRRGRQPSWGSVTGRRRRFG